MTGIPAGLRAAWDQELQGACEALIGQAGEYDGEDIIEANVALMNWLLAKDLQVHHLAAAAAALALRLHRSGGAQWPR